MILEKDKVYKVKHVVYGTKRNYVIFSPINDIVLPEDFFDKIYGGYHFDIYCHFIICFDSSIKTEFDLSLGLPQTGIYRDCTILELNGKDIQEIKKVIEKMGNTYKYNRKLNKLINKLNPKKIYKICHSDIQIGGTYSNFKALTNCIIFLPTGVIEHYPNYKGEIIPTRFLITFDLNVILGHFTSYDNGSVFQTLTENDYNLIVEVFKTRGKLKELSILLKDTNYRYNRKLDKIIDYENK